jgi:hypothetical protein
MVQHNSRGAAFALLRRARVLEAAYSSVWLRIVAQIGRKEVIGSSKKSGALAAAHNASRRGAIATMSLIWRNETMAAKLDHDALTKRN